MNEQIDPKVRPAFPASLTAALAAFQEELPDVGKGSTNPAFKTRYADLADVVKAVLPALAKQGLAWTAIPTMTKRGAFVLKYELRHVAGEHIGGVWPLPDPERVTSQALGSAVTYAKRYALSAVTGIAPDEDDDGNAASTAGSAVPEERGSAAAKPARRTQTRAPSAKAQAASAAAGAAGAIPQRSVASRDWISAAESITDYAELKSLADQIQKAGDWKLPVTPSGPPINEYMLARKAELTAPAASEGQTEEQAAALWPTTQIPE